MEVDTESEEATEAAVTVVLHTVVAVAMEEVMVRKI